MVVATAVSYTHLDVYKRQGLNFTGAKEHYGHEYNVKTGKIDVSDGSTTLTNVSYKLEF